MLSWGPAEAHRVPQRAAHYTGELNSVNTFLEVFLGCALQRCGGVPSRQSTSQKISFFPGKYRYIRFRAANPRQTLWTSARSWSEGSCRLSRANPADSYRAIAEHLASGRVSSGTPVLVFLLIDENLQESVPSQLLRDQKVTEAILQLSQRFRSSRVVLSRRAYA